jgi:hypothetical protein
VAEAGAARVAQRLHHLAAEAALGLVGRACAGESRRAESESLTLGSPSRVCLLRALRTFHEQHHGRGVHQCRQSRVDVRLRRAWREARARALCVPWRTCAAAAGSGARAAPHSAAVLALSAAASAPSKRSTTAPPCALTA